MENTDVLLGALENRAFLYSLAWRLLAESVDADVLTLAASEDVATQVQLLVGAQAGRLTDVQQKLAQAATDAHAHDLNTEYTRLFIGPGKLPAPPWESVYLADGDLLFQESTLKVREAYKEAGYQAAGYPHEADDHVATELNFMVMLIQGTIDALQAGNTQRARAFLLAQQKFLNGHLNKWLPSFADRLNEQAPSDTSPFYPLTAYFAAELCACDVEAVEDLLAALS